MEILAILGVKNSNVYLNNNRNTVPSITRCTGTYELNYKARVTCQISNGHAQNFMESVIDGLQ